jgi:hypothetical protein
MFIDKRLKEIINMIWEEDGSSRVVHDSFHTPYFSIISTLDIFTNRPGFEAFT